MEEILKEMVNFSNGFVWEYMSKSYLKTPLKAKRVKRFRQTSIWNVYNIEEGSKRILKNETMVVGLVLVKQIEVLEMWRKLLE